MSYILNKLNIILLLIYTITGLVFIFTIFQFTP